MKIRQFNKWLLLQAVVILAVSVLVAGCNSSGLSNEITEAGSTTVQPLAELLANAFMQENPDVNIIVQGGGSSVGIKSAAEGTVDIGATSRELKENEVGTVVPFIIAKDGIAIVVHQDNPISGLTREQVKGIFDGEITNWSELGGVDAGIHVVAREEGSGTRAAFEELIMGTEGLIINSAIMQPSNGAIRTTVSGDADAIGFLSFGYLDESTKTLAIDGVVATVETALDGSYPVVRPLIFVTGTEPEGLVKDFLDFVLSSEGQKIVGEHYIPVG